VPYDAAPQYSPIGGSVARGWAAAFATLPATVRSLAIDGPAVLDWDRVAAEAGALLPGRVELIDLRAAARPWPEVQRSTRSPALADDPDFETLAGGTLAALLDPGRLPSAPPDPGTIRVLFGPGTADSDADVLWWADLPKRYAEAAVIAGQGRNLMAPPGEPATTKRLFYIDWPLLDRHRDEHAGRIDLWIDTQDADAPTWLTGESLRATCGALARRPHRTRPVFNSTTWGGQWAREELGHQPDGPNTALGYELIAPESGVLLGDTGADTDQVEVPFQLLVALFPEQMLGPAVHERFGTSFPIRFDYLDTVGGGNLSVHCHPQPDYMREVFGWPYTQHETYYMMVGGEQNRVFLGLRADADLEKFHEVAHRAATEAIPFDMTDFVQTFPATEHQIFLIPAGTPHGSGEGNVVLEVSATPYLYSLRFYDWLRTDRSGGQRPVHVGHAFRNLDPGRAGAAVAERLVPRPVPLGDGEELIGGLPEMFFEVRRLTVEAGAELGQDTGGRFHVLTLVEGERVTVGGHPLNYAETIAVPAAVGAYRVRNLGAGTARLVKAHVTA
jgi:mannose-6-phosphate isomerase class I